MADIVVCVPKGVWQDWLEEGNLPGEPWDPDEDDYHWFSRGPVPHIDPGERVYVVAHGRLRGYAPLVRIDHRAQWATPPGWWWDGATFGLVRRGGAVACTIPESIRGFPGWRYRWWPYTSEHPFPAWQTEGVPL